MSLMGKVMFNPSTYWFVSVSSKNKLYFFMVNITSLSYIIIFFCADRLCQISSGGLQITSVIAIVLLVTFSLHNKYSSFIQHS